MTTKTISPSARWPWTKAAMNTPTMVSVPSSLPVVCWRLSRSSAGRPTSWMSAIIPFYVKTAYHDEPTFANTKVAMALYPNELKNILGENFKKTLEFKEANEELLKPYDDHFDLIELGKLAIDYSDGVIEGQTPITESLIKYAEDKQRPLLRYPGEDYAKAYTDFFDTLI